MILSTLTLTVYVVACFAMVAYDWGKQNTKFCSARELFNIDYMFSALTFGQEASVLMSLSNASKSLKVVLQIELVWVSKLGVLFVKNSSI